MQIFYPRARKTGLMVKKLGEETLVYDLESDKAHCLNLTAAEVWKACDGSTSVPEIAQRLGRALQIKVDEKLVWYAVDQLGKDDLLETRSVLPPALAGLNRRQMIRALGLAAAVAVPVVTSIVAPTPSQAATCKPSGASCGSPAECCSGLCNAGTCA